MKNHECNRCRRHVADAMEVRLKSGRRRTYCARCIETMQAKGQVVELHPVASERRRERLRAHSSGQR